MSFKILIGKTLMKNKTESDNDDMIDEKFDFIADYGPIDISSSIHMVV